MERFTWGRGRPILTVDGIIPDLNWGSGEGGAQMSDGLPFPASRVEQAAPTTLRKCQHKHFLPQVALCEVKGTDIKKTKQKKKNPAFLISSGFLLFSVSAPTGPAFPCQPSSKLSKRLLLLCYSVARGVSLRLPLCSNGKLF